MNLTALIPVYNDAYCLRLCLESIAEHFDEILVFDDASTDETSDIASDCATRHPHVRYVRHQGEQLGWVGARNRLLELARGDYHFWLDSDDVLCEHKAKDLRRLAEAATAPKRGADLFARTRCLIARLGLCEMWGDLNHTTQRLKHHDRCHVFVNRRLVGAYSWRGEATSKLANVKGIPQHSYRGVLFFHLKGVKPDRRIIERGRVRKWLRAGRPGPLHAFASLEDLSEEEIHSRALKVLLESRQDTLTATYAEDEASGSAAPTRPAVIEAEIKAGQRFRMVYENGRPVDRIDAELDAIPQPF